MSILVDETRCVVCKQEFDPPRRVKWGEIGFDMKTILAPWERFENDVETRVTAPVCGQCWEPLFGAVSGVSMHPEDIAQLPRREASQGFPGGLDALLGIPVTTDETLQPGTVELRYKGKTQAEVVQAYEDAMAQLKGVDSDDGQTSRIG